MKHFAVRGILAGVPMLIVGIFFMWLTNTLIPSVAAEYQNTAIFYPMTDWHWQSMPLYYFVLGTALSWVWEKVRILNLSPLHFALGYWIVASVPGMFITFLSFNISIAMILVWLGGMIIDGVLAGYAFRMMDRRQVGA